MNEARRYFMLALSLSLTVFCVAAANEAKSDAGGFASVTTQSPEIPREQLELLVDPLTVDELVVEADAWRDLLRVKVEEISTAQIAAKKNKEQISKQEDAASVAETASEAKKVATEARDNELVESVTALTDARSALARRLEVVLDELDDKGGDSASYRKYIAAVSGLQIDAGDWDAVWTMATVWVKSPEGGLRWGINLAKCICVLFAFWILSRVLGAAVEKATHKSTRMSTLLRKFLPKVVRRVVIIVGVVMGLAALDIDVSPVLAAIGGAAFVVAFALQGTLSNFASGVLILTYRPFDVGDVVDAGGVSGKVESMNLVSTHILTFDNKLMVVPNNKIWGDVITNATGTSQRRVDMVFGIGYSDDIDKAQAILEKIVGNHEKVLKTPEAVIKVHELADSSVNFVCRPWVRTADYWTVYWDITRQVKSEFDKNGVSIPFPQRDLHVYQEPTSSA